VKTVLKTTLSYLGSILLALLLAGGVTYGINIEDHGHFVGIVVCYAIYFMGGYMALFVPFLILVHVTIRKSCAHVLLPLVAILFCAVGFLVLVEYSPPDSERLLHLLFVLSLVVVLPVFSISLGATAALWRFRSTDVKAQKEFRVFLALSVLAAILLFLTIAIFHFRSDQIRQLDNVREVEVVVLRDDNAVSTQVNPPNHSVHP